MIGERINFRCSLNTIEAEIIEDAFEFEAVLLNMDIKRTLVVTDEGALVIVHRHRDDIWFCSIYNNMEF